MARERIRELLEDLRQKKHPSDDGLDCAADPHLSVLSYKDFPIL
jgi:hypothetical protein